MPRMATGIWRCITLALTDAAGTLSQTYRTDAFGVPTATQGASTQPFRFAGEQTDATGLVYLRARLYDPQSGRFVQRDTVVQGGQGSQGLNRYTYVQNNPVNLADPSGRCIGPAVVVCFGGVGGWFVAGGALATGTSLYLAQHEVGQRLFEGANSLLASAGDRLRGRDALNAERRKIRYYTRGMSPEQRGQFQREIETTKEVGGMGGDEALSDEELEAIRNEVLGPREVE